MAEFCKECFKDVFHPSKDEYDRIVLSVDNDFCEGCMNCTQYVDHFAKTVEAAKAENEHVDRLRHQMKYDIEWGGFDENY